MPTKIKTCKQCGQQYKRLSVRKLCWNCSTLNMLSASKQLKEKNGEYYERWLMKMKQKFN